MPPTKAPPARIPAQAEPVLENFYDVGLAAVKLGLKTAEQHKAGSKLGEKWLRDGFNRPTDGSKGRKFPGRYMAGRLKFSESELVEIAQIALEESAARRKPKPSTGRPRRLRTRTPALATT
ncbi:MAG: hypothetical protein HOV82_16920 [Streptomyces sp.]|nr:hypothetical protein [Streptomyces sp.]NUP36226.1 hypothetical protein [Streptomyces sp.]NUS75573.1 hypothetical protein [Streptomyces sp.]